MISFDPLSALLAGLAGTIAMTVMMQGATATGMTKMPSMALIQGLVFTDDVEQAKRIGVLTHVLMMGTVVFGLGYAGIFTLLDDASIVTGAVLGLGHGIVAGVAMGTMGSMHPRMVAPSAMSGPRDGAVATLTGGESTLVEPGLFARNYGPMTPIGLVMGHVIFGLVVALVYGAV